MSSNERRKSKDETGSKERVTVKPLKTSLKMCSTKSEAQITSALSKYEAEVLSLPDIKDLLKNLNISNVVVLKSKTVDLANDIWTLLDAETRHGATKQSLQTILPCILGSSTINKVKEVEDDAMKIGKYDETTASYSLSQEEKEYLSMKYGNSVKYHLLSRRSTSNPRQKSNTGTYSPRTNSNSGKLAEAARSKIVSKAAENPSDAKSIREIPVHNILLMHNTVKETYCVKP